MKRKRSEVPEAKGFRVTAQGYVRYGPMTCRGLVPTLKAQFYPEYDYKLAYLGPMGTKATSARKVDRGTSGGKRMDQMVDLLVKVCRHLPHIVALDDIPITPENTKDMRALQCGNPLFRQFLMPHLVQRQWTPIASQIPVGDAFLRLATCVDLVVRDALGALLLIEIKTGYTGYYHRHTSSNMHKPFEDLNNSPYHQHQLQLAFTRHYLAQQWGQPTDTIPALVLQINPLGIWEWPCIIDHKRCEDAQFYLSCTKDQTQKQRKRSMSNGRRRERYKLHAKSKREGF